MSRFLTANAIAQFDAQVHQAYQGGATLRRTVRLKTGIVGSTVKFPKIGKGIATPRVPQSDVVPMNVNHGNVTATLTDWNAPEYTDIFDQQKVNYSEQSALAYVIASAIGRREDQLILDALDAASSTLTVDTNVGGNTTGLNVAKLRRAAKLLNDQGGNTKPRYFVGSTTGQEQLLGATEVTSSDFNTVKALVNGEINSFLGFEFIWMETRDEGGLPLATNDRTNYAYHGGPMGAVGMAVGIDFRTEVNYIPEKTSWLANGLFSAGAVAIDALGIVEITTTES